MGLRWAACLAFVFLLSSAAGSARGAPPVLRPPPELPFTVNSDSFEYEQKREIYTAAGNVRVVQEGGGTLSADWMVLNYETRVGVAVGNVVIRDAGDLIETDFARVNLATLEVLARDGRIDSEDPALVVEGGWLSKTGENRYAIQNGLFTTCRCPPGRTRRPWEITASQADVEVGGYASARNVVFKTLGVPILYAPYALFPVKSERESGFLVPTFGRSRRSGAELEVPFFWAARDNLNILLSPQYFSERGLKTTTELQYVFGESGYGDGGFSFLPSDNDIKDNDPSTRFSSNRFAFWLRHEQPLGDGSRFGLDLKSISDNQYVLDFDDFNANERNARFLKSSGWLSKARDGLYGTVELATFDDLQNPNDLDRDQFFLQKLPDVHLSMLPREVGLGPFEASADLRYTYFYQRKDVRALRGRSPVNGQFFDTGRDGLFDPDEPDAKGRFPAAGGLAVDTNGDNGGGRRRGEGDGRFQEGELIADRGQRVDFYPKLTLPYRLGLLETLSEVGLRETFYAAEEAGSENRDLFTARLDARTRFQRAFQVGKLNLWHRVEPRIGFSVVSGDQREQERNPLFIPGSPVRTERLIDADPRLLLRNPSDRISDERFLNFAVSNQLYAPALIAGKPPREVAELRVGSGYDFLEGRQTNIFVDARFDPNPSFGLTGELGYDPKDTSVDELAAGLFLKGQPPMGLARSQMPRSNQAMVTYRFLRDGIDPFENFKRNDDVFEDFTSNLDRVDQVDLTTNYVISRQLDFFASGYQSFEDSEVRGGGFGLNFFSSCGCWEVSLRVDTTTRPDDTRLGLEFRLEGLGVGVKRDLDTSNRRRN